MKSMVRLTAIAVALLGASAAQAVQVDWTDWTAGDRVAGTAVGAIMSDGMTVDVSYMGPSYSFIQTGAGVDYFATQGVPAPYTGGDVDNRPPASDIIALSSGGTSTVTFSKAVRNVVVALVSWNGNVADFNTPIEIVSEGPGHWGTGTFTNVTANGFTGSGELHGVIRLPGVLSSFTFTHTSESWHGIQVGIEGVDMQMGDVPLPATLPLLAGALGAAGFFGWRRRKAA